MVSKVTHLVVGHRPLSPGSKYVSESEIRRWPDECKCVCVCVCVYEVSVFVLKSDRREKSYYGFGNCGKDVQRTQTSGPQLL